MYHTRAQTHTHTCTGSSYNRTIQVRYLKALCSRCILWCTVILTSSCCGQPTPPSPTETRSRWDVKWCNGVGVGVITQRQHMCTLIQVKHSDCVLVSESVDWRTDADPNTHALWEDIDGCVADCVDWSSWWLVSYCRCCCSSSGRVGMHEVSDDGCGRIIGAIDLRTVGKRYSQ